jgi:ERF superfamily.
MEKKSKQAKLIPVNAEVLEPEETEGQEIIPAPAVQIQQEQNNQIDMLISKAVDRNVSIETMERLLAMRKELRAEKAKEAFDADMASFQGECPTIKKTKAGGKTESGVVAYHYAPIEAIVEQVKGLISKYGFSYAIKTETGEGKVKSTCIVKHRMGHSEWSEVEVPLGIKQNNVGYATCGGGFNICQAICFHQCFWNYDRGRRQ